MGKGHNEKPAAAPERDPDAYRTLDRDWRAELRIEGSRFIACARGAASAEEALSFLAELRAEHHAATHHCSAWRVGALSPATRSSDDGEPSGTAGRRILAAIEEAELTDVAVVVVRYFGGVKLGTGGLARAYHEAAALVLSEAAPVERIVTASFAVRFGYDWTRQVHHAVDLSGAEILSRNYGDETEYVVRIRASRAEELLRRLDELTQRNATTQKLVSP